MKEEIDRINQTLPDTPSGWDNAAAKTTAIRQWIRSVLLHMEHYKVEHKVLVKEAMTLLELALWKAKLLQRMGRRVRPKAKIDKESTRKSSEVVHL